MNRRELLALLASGALTGIPRALHGTPAAHGRSRQAGCMGGRRIRWLVGWTPGGGYDGYVRLVEPFLEKALEAEIVVDNRTGAAGRVAALALARARPDGRTLGILDAPGLLWWSASGEADAPRLQQDFTLLARLARTEIALAAGPRSGIRTINDVLARTGKKRIAFGASAPGSQNFVSGAVVAAALGIDADFVVGYPGSREVALGLVRGDFDLLTLNIESISDLLAAGDAIPLATLNAAGLEGTALPEVPSLDVALTANARGPARARGLQLSATLASFLAAGRVVAAPGKLPDGIRHCLVGGLQEVLASDQLRAAARRASRTLSPAFEAELQRDVSAAAPAAAALVPVASDALRRIR